MPSTGNFPHNPGEPMETVLNPPTPATQRLPAAFQRLVWSNLAAQSAEQVALAASPIVAVLFFGAGAQETGWLQTAQTLPFLLLAVPAGVLADRMSRPRLMAGAEALRAGALLATLLLVAVGGLTLPLLGLLGFLGACGTVVYGVSAPVLVPSLVPAPAFPVANGRIELARTVAFTAGPPVAGALVGWVGAVSAFGVAAALSLGAVLLLSGVKEPVRPSAPRRHIWHELREGAVFLAAHPLLRPVFACRLVFTVALFMLLGIYVPYAIHGLGLTAAEVGSTLATYGVGMVFGALVAPWLLRTAHFGVVVATGPLTGLTAAGVMLLTLWLPTPLLAAASFFLMGAGPMVYLISTATLQQTVTPRPLLGRVSAINSLAYGARPVGAALGALVGGAYGEATCLAVAAVLFLLQALVILASPVMRLARQPELAA